MGWRLTAVQILVTIGPLVLTRTGMADMYIALYTNDPSGTNGPGQLLGAPMLIGSRASGTFSNQGVYNWITIDVTGNPWGVLSPSTYYWFGVLPGSTFQIQNTLYGTYEGIVLGGIVDQFGTILPQVIGDPVMYTSRELGSQIFAGDSANGCNVSSALPSLRNFSFWRSVPGFNGRYRDSSLTVPYVAVRHGLNMYGVEVGG